MARKRSDVFSPEALAHVAAEPTKTVRERVLEIATQLESSFVGRKEAITAMVLAHLAGEHYLFVGEPGTAKSALATAFASHIVGAKKFKITLGSFTPPEAVFGPLDIEEFTVAKRYVHATENMAPEADLCMFDECFKGSDGLINSFLTLLNEREFAGEKTPLHCAGLATNWPELESRSDNVKALYDRALLRVAVEELSEVSDVVAMLRAIDGVRSYAPQTTITMDELRAVSIEARQIPICEPVRELLAQVRNRLAFKTDSSGTRRPHIAISARRLGQLQHVLRVAAWLDGAEQVTVEHFGVLRFGLWNDRRDIESVNAVLNSVDSDQVRKIIALVDQGRQAIKQLQQDGRTPANFNRTSDIVRRAAVAAREEFDKPLLTKQGREDARKAIQGIRADFHAMMANSGSESE